MPHRPDFETLVAETEDMIFSLGLRLFRNNEEDALDFAQDVFLQAYRKLDTFRGQSKLSTWLYSLALNLGLTRIKKEKRLRFSHEENQLEKLVAPKSGQPDKEVLALLEREELSREITHALAELPEAYRLPLVLHFFEGLSYKEISAKTGIPEGSIKSNVYRAKLQLRNSLRRDLL